jgi:hypothetical protein
MTALFTTPSRQLRKRLQKAYDESKHPRDKDGQFASTGGGQEGSHLIIDNKTGKVVGTATTLGYALRAVARRNKMYGAHRYHTVDEKTYNLRQMGWPDD